MTAIRLVRFYDNTPTFNPNGVGVFRDDNPATPPSERYKMIGGFGKPLSKAAGGTGVLMTIAHDDAWCLLIDTLLPCPPEVTSHTVVMVYTGRLLVGHSIYRVQGDGMQHPH